jgi:hypothetical protein
VGVGIVKENEAIIFNNGQIILEEVSQRDFQITTINPKEADI